MVPLWVLGFIQTEAFAISQTDGFKVKSNSTESFNNFNTKYTEDICLALRRIPILFRGRFHRNSEFYTTIFTLFSRFPNSSDCSTVGLDEIISGSRISNQSTNRRCVELFNSPLQVRAFTVSMVKHMTAHGCCIYSFHFRPM